MPLDSFRVTVMVDYHNSALGSQHTGLFDLEKEFVNEFAPARTFCFISEIEKLASAGLIKGGSLDNAICFADKKMDVKELHKLQKMLQIKDEYLYLNLEY